MNKTNTDIWPVLSEEEREYFDQLMPMNKRLAELSNKPNGTLLTEFVRASLLAVQGEAMAYGAAFHFVGENQAMSVWFASPEEVSALRDLCNEILERVGNGESNDTRQ